MKLICAALLGVFCLLLIAEEIQGATSAPAGATSAPAGATSAPAGASAPAGSGGGGGGAASAKLPSFLFLTTLAGTVITILRAF